MAIEAKHKRTCAVCHGSGTKKTRVVNRKTGKVEEHSMTCPGCGGSGQQGY